jgi:hypothetical protein
MTNRIILAAATVFLCTIAAALFYETSRISPYTAIPLYSENIITMLKRSVAPIIVLPDSTTTLPAQRPNITPTVLQHSSKEPSLPTSSAFSEKTAYPIISAAFVELECHFASSNDYMRGSGMIVDKTGIILTNRHVATYVEADGTDKHVQYPTDYCEVGVSSDFNFAAETIYSASMLWADNHQDNDDAAKISFDHDFALLKIDKLIYGRADCLKKYPASQTLCQLYPATLPSTFPALHIGNPKELLINDYITIIGYPSEFFKNNKLMKIAGPIKEIYLNIIEAEAPVEKGYSGSAVLNQNNELVGLLTAGKTGNFADFIRTDWIQSFNPVWK